MDHSTGEREEVNSELRRFEAIRLPQRKVRGQWFEADKAQGVEDHCPKGMFRVREPAPVRQTQILLG